MYGSTPLPQRHGEVRYDERPPSPPREHHVSSSAPERSPMDKEKRDEAREDAVQGLTFYLQDYTHTYQDPAARMELPFGFRRMLQLMEGGVMGAPLQERLRSKFGILKNDKVMYKMELGGSGVSMDVEDKHDFDDFTNTI